MFKSFKEKFQKNFAELTKNQDYLFRVDIDKETMWNTYLESFTDPVEKQHHNCNCCKSFIRHYGNVVVIDKGVVKSMWDISSKIDELYKPACIAMNQLISNANVSEVFFTKERKAGVGRNIQRLETGDIYWEHFSLDLPSKFVTNSSRSIESLMGQYRDNRNVFKRSLEEITQDALDTVYELISQKSIYRGDEFKSTIIDFMKCKKEYEQANNKENYCWQYSVQLPPFIAKIRNSAIGTLLIDISEGKELDYAVGAFERMVAPTNYKRPNAIATKAQIAAAEKTITDMGLLNSLGRRFATAEDILVSDLLFVNRDSKVVGGIFQQLADDVKVNPKSFSKIEEIGIDDFIARVLPTCKSVEMLFENNQVGNLMSLVTAIDSEAPSLFKWDNTFSWSYKDGIADSMKERVKAAGGNVDGVLRCSMQWNEDGRSNTDLDLHCIEPDGNQIYYGNCCGRGNVSKLSGNLDVDMRSSYTTMVENMVWTNQSKMKKGIYKFFVNNFNNLSNTGFTIQIEFNGEIFELYYNKQLKNKIAIALDDEVKQTKEKSFIKTRTVVNKTLETKLEVVKHIIETKLAEKDAKILATQKAQQKAQLQELLDRKKLEALGEKSIEELQKEIEALG